MKEKDEKGTLLRWLFPLELFPFDRNDRWAYIEINQLGIKNNCEKSRLLRNPFFLNSTDIFLLILTVLGDCDNSQNMRVTFHSKSPTPRIKHLFLSLANLNSLFYVIFSLKYIKDM